MKTFTYLDTGNTYHATDDYEGEGAAKRMVVEGRGGGWWTSHNSREPYPTNFDSEADAVKWVAEGDQTCG